MHTRNFVIYGVVISVVLISGIVWFGLDYKPKQKNIGELTFGLNLWPGALPFVVAQERGYFEEEGLHVNFNKADDYGTALGDLQNGKNDIATISLIDAMLGVSKGETYRVVSIIDYSNGADGIVAKKNIIDIRGLKGKKVAVELGANGEYMLRAVLKKAGLSLSDIKIVNLSSKESAQAFIDGSVDSAVVYEPDLSRAVSIGNGKKIYTSADDPSLIADVIVAKKEYIDARPEYIRAFVEAQYMATQYINDNPVEAYALGAKFFGVRPDDFRVMMSGVKLLGQSENSTAFSYAAGFDSIFGNGRQINTFLKLVGRIEKGVDVKEIILPDFVHEVGRRIGNI